MKPYDEISVKIGGERDDRKNSFDERTRLM